MYRVVTAAGEQLQERNPVALGQRGPLAGEGHGRTQNASFWLRQQINGAGHHHMLNIGIGQGLAQGFVELVQHYHGFYIGIIKLVHQFAHGVHGVGINHYQAQLPGGNYYHRILNKIG